MKNWVHFTASELGAAIHSGKINPVALCEAQLAQIDQHPLREHIYARLTPGRARAEAQAAAIRAKDGQRRSPLDGVPLSWKDLFDTAGCATEAGSALLRGRTPEKDAEVLRQATLQGLVCLGKTHMSELAFSGLGLNPITATPPCINDTLAVAGGSSSGAAASVAYGLAPAAIGSDTGGSVRIPAAWNDLVGLKTSFGRLPLIGTVPLCESFDTIGPIARSVEDCAQLMAAMENRVSADLRGTSLNQCRLMVLETVALEDLRQGPASAFDDAIQRLGRAGAQINSQKLPFVSEAMALAGLLFAPEAYGIWHEVIEAAPHKMYPRILERFRGGAQVGASAYVAAWRRLREIRALWAAQTAAYDAVIMPTSPILPPNIERLLTDESYYLSENLLALRNTRIANLMDCCALTLPLSQPSCGISFLTPPRTEERLLRIGTAAEPVLR